MNKRVKRMWVKALRSGEYKQGRSFLRIGEAHCCLGVLCELAIKDGVPVRRRRVNNDVFYNFDSDSSGLPPRVRQWAGIASTNGAIPEHPRALSLAARNDAGWSFKRIATLIEKKF